MCEIFTFSSFLDSKSVNGVCKCKLLQLLGEFVVPGLHWRTRVPQTPGAPSALLNGVVWLLVISSCCYSQIALQTRQHVYPKIRGSEMSSKVYGRSGVGRS